MQTQEQERAAYAWESVKNQKKDYRNLVKSAPALVMSNGLMQTLAFLEGKGKQYHKSLLRHILGWLAKKKMVDNTNFGQAMNSLSGKDSLEYQRATEETLALLRWLRHLADAAIIDGEDGGENA